MANNFKVVTDAAAPASAGSFDTVYTCPGSTTTVVLGLMLCNIHTSYCNGKCETYFKYSRK